MNQWTEMARRWTEWGSPLRPSPEDVELIAEELRPHGRHLLLGSTPELSRLARFAVDGRAEVLKAHEVRGAAGDWRRLPIATASVDAVIGDGSLNVFEGDPSIFFNEVRRVVRPGGKIVLRVFLAPGVQGSLARLLADPGRNFHAFKWRVAGAVARPHVSVRVLYEIIKPVWDHPTLEVYRDSSAIYYFPRLSDLPPWERIRFPTSYELSERCPVVTWTC